LAEDIPVETGSLRKYYTDAEFKVLSENSSDPRSLITLSTDFVRTAFTEEGIENGLLIDKLMLMDMMKTAGEYQLAIQSTIKIASGGIPHALIKVGTVICHLLVYTIPFALIDR